MTGRLWGGGPIKRIFIDPLWRPWHLLVLWAWPLRVWPLYVRHSILRYWGGNNVIYILTIDPGSRKKIKMDCLRVCTYFFWYLIESKQMKIRFDGHPKQSTVTGIGNMCHNVFFRNAVPKCYSCTNTKVRFHQIWVPVVHQLQNFHSHH